jgi:signal transduction histidine kinase
MAFSGTENLRDPYPAWLRRPLARPVSTRQPGRAIAFQAFCARSGVPVTAIVHIVLPCAGFGGVFVLAACLSFLVLASGAQAGPVSGDQTAAPALELHDGKNVLAGHAFVLEDERGTRTIGDVRTTAASKFRVLRPRGEASGFTSAVYWLRFRVKNVTASSTFIVDLSDRATASPAIAELHDEAGGVWRTGAALPFHERAVETASIAFRIALGPGEVGTFWIRQWSTDSMMLSPVAWPEQQFWEMQSDERLRNGLCYGVLAGLALYNLFLFLATRDRGYLFYVAFQVLNGLTQAAFDKYTFEYLWPDHPVWGRRSEQVLSCLAIAAALVFARAFLGPGRRSPWLDRAMRMLPVPIVVVATAGALTDQSTLQMLIGALILGSIGVVTLAALQASLRGGSSNARVFLVAWTVLLAGATMAVLTALGAFSWDDGFYLMKLGSALEAVLLSLALASRINALTRDRERAQREVVAAKTARIEALRQLVSGVAHEVGNPLNFARGGSDELGAQLEAIGERVPGADAPARRAHRLVALGLSRIKLILDNLRCYLSVGEADAVPTDLAHEIEQALELTGERLAAAGVRVDKQIDPLPAVRARPGELHQVLLNLIGNAVEAMPGGGTLRVVARAGESGIEVAVSDTGPGIAAADRDKVFEPFFTTRQDTGGTGLGLAVAREIVMKNGGTIRAEDNPGGGARFVVSLPRVHAA